MWRGDDEYEKEWWVRGVLRRYGAACRRMGRPPAAVVREQETRHAEGNAHRPLEWDVALVVDVERLLGRLTEKDRAALVLVGQRGWPETVAAKRLHMGWQELGQRYWRGVRVMHRLLVEAGYAQRVEGGSGEETECKASVAQVESRVARR